MRMGAMNKLGNLPAVILAGGKGTRLSEETATIPKPMLTVGDKPLLQHVMDIYLAQGVWNFIIPVGYKKEVVLGYFLGHKGLLYFTYDHHGAYEFQFGDYKVTVVDTGPETQTGGRLKRLYRYLGMYTDFFFTYGDGVGNVNLHELVRHHTGDTLVTMTAVHPAGRFGRIIFENMEPGPLYSMTVRSFGEKMEHVEDWVNGGFSILSTKLFLGLAGDHTNLEKDVFPVVAQHGAMRAYKHFGFWRCVDTLRDLEELRSLYKEENVPWLQSLQAEPDF